MLKMIKGIKIKEFRPMLTHLLFVDDSLFLMKAHVSNLMRLRDKLR